MRESLLQGLIFSIDRFSAEDGPGIRTTVFMKGCPLSCIWCHSPQCQGAEGPQLGFYSSRCIGCAACVEVCPHKAQMVCPTDRRVLWDKCDNCGKCVDVCPSMALEMVGNWLTVEQLMNILKKDWVYYKNSGGGVTFSGGEPTAQAGFLAACLKRCKELEIHTAVDTCGFAEWAVFEEILPYVDLFLYDIKHMDSTKHKRFTGVGNELILKNLKKVSQHGKSIWIRIPLIPGYTDSEENLRQTGEFVRELKGVERVSLLPYNTAAGARYSYIGRKYELEHLGLYPKQRKRTCVESFSSLGIEVGT